MSTKPEVAVLLVAIVGLTAVAVFLNRSRTKDRARARELQRDLDRARDRQDPWR
ncbi:MAG: hypothetical protein WCH00_03005 [Candidatus Saccharibacteria bacterium]